MQLDDVPELLSNNAFIEISVVAQWTVLMNEKMGVDGDILLGDAGVSQALVTPNNLSNPAQLGELWNHRLLERPRAEFFLVPVHVNQNHFALCVFNLQTGGWEYWDSLMGAQMRCPRALKHARFLAFFRTFSPATPRLFEPRVVPIPQQTGCNCGIFCIEFMRAFCLGHRDGTKLGRVVREEFMADRRRHIKTELVDEKRILPLPE